LPEKTPQNPDSPEDSKKEKVPEIRYVPIEYMPHMDEEEEYDLIDLIKPIWDGRITILKFVTFFLLVGIFVALFSGEEFESESILIPEIQQAQQGRAGQLLQQFGGAFGLGGGTLSDGSSATIPPMVYPRIVNSLSFQAELLKKEIDFRSYGVKTTLPDFFENHYNRPITSIILDYTVKLPFTIRAAIGSEETTLISESDYDLDQGLLVFTQKEIQLINDLRDRISVNIDQESGLLNVKTKLPDPRAAAEINRAVTQLLKDYVTEYRIEKARQDLEFIEEQHQNARERFQDRQMVLAEFRDQNVSLATARAQTELERLQDEKNLAFNIYNSLSQQLEQSRIKLQEQTPVFTELQRANVPTERSEPKRALLLIACIIIGLFLSVIWIYVSNFFIHRFDAST